MRMRRQSKDFGYKLPNFVIVYFLSATYSRLACALPVTLKSQQDLSFYMRKAV